MRLTTDSVIAPRGRASPRPRRPAVALAALAATFLLIFGLDKSSGLGSVQHLYYIPIAVAAVRFGMSGGVLASLAAIVLYHWANPYLLALRYEEFDVLQIAVFMAAGILTARVASDRRRLYVLAMTDDLTGLHNLRSFETKLADLLRHARATGTSVALFVLDLDRLKSLNDAYGHLTGAEAVRALGHIIGATMPPGAVACRYGGDEFVIAIPGCDHRQATAWADELRRGVHRAAPVLAGIPFAATTLSVSIGVVCATPGKGVAGETDDQRGDALFRSADAALYRAKQAGRNQVCVAGAGHPSPAGGGNGIAAERSAAHHGSGGSTPFPTITPHRSRTDTR